MFYRKKIIILTGFLFFLGFFLISFDFFGNSHQSLNFEKLIVENIEVAKDEKIKEVVLLGKAEISYVGSTSGRIKNIQLGIARLDGQVVPAGEEFSFIKYLGPIAESDGFSKEKAFKNGEVTLGLGGGLCHVSSTLFQSVLASGLPVTERYNHTFSVPFYKIGLDAAYSNPAPDFKFVNDTGYDITIKGHTEEDKAVFEIYGIDHGRQVFISEPRVYNKTSFPLTKYINTEDLPKGVKECEHTPQNGYTAEVIYDVFFPTGENKQQIFTSVYQPLAEVCYVGVGKGGLQGCTSTTLFSPVTGEKCPISY